MLATKGNSSMAAEVVNAVPTGAESNSPITFGAKAIAQMWDRIIDRQFIEWGIHPDLLRDDGVEPPSGDVIQRAGQLASILKDRGVVAPDIVVPDPNGGIVLEWRAGDVTETLHVWDDGIVEYCRFEGTRLVERRAV